MLKSAFNNKVNYSDLNRVAMMELENQISPEDRDRLRRVREYWNFYEGYHWEDVPMGDKPQITENYCRKFVDKFVSFELGMGFTISVPFEQTDEDNEETKVNKFLDYVWNDNHRDSFCIELGQSKGVTGDGWVQVLFKKPSDLDDPFEEYPKGRIKLSVIPTNIVFAEYDEHDKDILTKVTIAYPIQRYDKSAILKTPTLVKKIYKQVWTTEKIEIYEGKDLIETMVNPYKVIPFVQIKNVPLVGRTSGVSDLEDIIPLNMELNFKKSDISEIIDYHSAPVTVVYGAKVSALEKGANKVWGGLPKDSRVENLELNSDLGASVNYTDHIKMAMHEVGGIPEGSLGGDQAISNTSGVALQFVNMPLIERTRVKRMETSKGLRLINKIILLIALREGLIEKPEDIEYKDFYNTEIDFPDTLPKDRLLELQQIQLEMEMGIESKMGAMRRLNKDNPTVLLAEIEKERQEEEEKMFETQRKQALINIQNQIDSAKIQSEMGLNQTPKAEKHNGDDEDTKKDSKKVNSGMTNGETPIEQVRKETAGKNG